VSEAARSRLTHIWIFLSVVTLISWRVAALHSPGARAADAIGAVAIAGIACVKCGLVLWRFMEVGRAPAWLRRTCLTWLAVFFAAVLSLYFMPP
jgi:hypothetical protein